MWFAEIIAYFLVGMLLLCMIGTPLLAIIFFIMVPIYNNFIEDNKDG